MTSLILAIKFLLLREATAINCKKRVQKYNLLRISVENVRRMYEAEDIMRHLQV